MGLCNSTCKTEQPWKPFVETTVRNVVVHTLVVEPSLYMVKDCACKKCAKVNKRKPTHEEALQFSGMVEEAKREDLNSSKRKSMATR
jgi:hypothetical protein